MTGDPRKHRRKPRWDRSIGRPEPIRALEKIFERENFEPLVNISQLHPKISMGRPHTIPWARQQVAERLYRVAEAMPEDIELVVTEAWRPIERQQRIYDWFMRGARETFPDAPASTHRRLVNRFCAPPDSKAPPGHCTGGAVDVLLADSQGQLIDLSAPFDRFSAAPTFTFGLAPEAQKHRMLLYENLVAQGFSNCRDEYWHYSFGDAGWAVRLGLDECIYGLIPLDPEHYLHLESLHADFINARPNPFPPS
ncbi:MAG: M15 family metallopeptidase [Fimbriimonadaceae bacterium]